MTESWQKTSAPTSISGGMFRSYFRNLRVRAVGRECLVLLLPPLERQKYSITAMLRGITWLSRNYYHHGYEKAEASHDCRKRQRYYMTAQTDEGIFLWAIWLVADATASYFFFFTSLSRQHRNKVKIDRLPVSKRTLKKDLHGIQYTKFNNGNKMANALCDLKFSHETKLCKFAYTNLFLHCPHKLVIFQRRNNLTRGLLWPHKLIILRQTVSLILSRASSNSPIPNPSTDFFTHGFVRASC